LTISIDSRPERVVEQPADQGFDPHDAGGVLRALEKGIGDLPVVGMLGRIGLDRELPHRAHVLFRGNRHAERRVGAERLPILRRAPHVLVAQEHEDVLAVEGTFKDAGFLAGGTEGVGGRIHRSGREKGKRSE